MFPKKPTVPFGSVPCLTPVLDYSPLPLSTGLWSMVLLWLMQLVNGLIMVNCNGQWSIDVPTANEMFCLRLGGFIPTVPIRPVNIVWTEKN